LFQTNFKGRYQNLQNPAGQRYIGGDALRGASTAINAIGDGRKAAEQIIKQSGFTVNTAKVDGKNHSKNELMEMRSQRNFATEVHTISLEDSKTFKLVSQTLDENTIVEEAKRCLNCDEICNICTTVCPNLANYSYQVEPVSLKLQKVVIGENGALEYQPDKDFVINQRYQILILPISVTSVATVEHSAQRIVHLIWLSQKSILQPNRSQVRGGVYGCSTKR
jgi:putative selenate reductase